tara:strand:+ start:3757 stop:3975 length:219 start_codon:yes stop_codon:yes gene_type:complete
MEDIERMENVIASSKGKNGKKGKWKTVLHYINLRKEVGSTLVLDVVKSVLSGMWIPALETTCRNNMAVVIEK